jgi:YVTN family beta-propeller protein
LALSGSALARNAYVANSGDGTVSVVDAKTNAVVGAVAVGGAPVDVAITPDGTRAYVANKGSNTVNVIDTATNAVVANVVVGKEPVGIAVAPNGAFAYVSNFGDESVSLISTSSNSVPIGPILVGKEPEGVAISPDGSSAFVARHSGGVAVISTATNQVVGEVPDPFGPSRIALGPRGGRGFVTDVESSTVTAFNPATASVIGAPIPIGTPPAGIAIDPAGKVAYVASPSVGSVTPIDTSTVSPLNPPVGGFPGATGIAILPDGLHGYVTNGAGATVTVLDTSSTVASGTIGVGSKPTGVAAMPDQGPRASLWVSPARRRAKKPLTFHASGSVDPDGKIDNYVWDFGDGGHVEGAASTRTHRYRRPGDYVVTLRVVDDEGCSTEVVYTGQTAFCNGSAAALTSSTISVADAKGPVLRLRGPKRQRVRGRVDVLARCPREPCTVQARGTLITVVEGAGGKRRRSRRLLPANAVQPTTAWRTLHLRLRKRVRRAARRALAEGGEARARLSVVARDDDGELVLRQRKVTLVR